MDTRHRSGLAWAFLGVLLFSFSLPLTKVAVGGFDPFLTATGRAVIAGVLAAALLVAFRVPWPARSQLKPLLFRADQFRTKELAANIDQVAIVFAPQPPFNPLFLWRALLAARAAGIDSLLVLNKTDIADGLEAACAALDFGASLGVPTLSISARARPEATRDALREALEGRATLLVGQSGMGKSSLLNLLVDANARTQEYSRRLNVGKQTTTASRWFDLPGERGGALIDTPGFTAFGLAHLSLQQCADAMPDFGPYLGGCRFSNCRHLSEPGCAVLAAVERGTVLPQRHAFYRELADDLARQVSYA